MSDDSTTPLPPAVGIPASTGESMTVEAAQARKTELLNNADFRQRYLSREIAAVRAIDEVNVALSQTLGDSGRAAREIEAASLGLSPEHIAEYADRRPVTAEIRQRALDLRTQLHRDKAWCARYLDNDREAHDQIKWIGIILAAPVLQQK
jgi:hypothetical protein